jgi:hypothetical protein
MRFAFITGRSRRSPWENTTGTYVTAAAGPDGKVVVIVGEGIKVGEKMDCMHRGTTIDCKAITVKK